MNYFPVGDMQLYKSTLWDEREFFLEVNRNSNMPVNSIEYAIVKWCVLLCVNSFRDAHFPCIEVDHTSNLQHHLF